MDGAFATARPQFLQLYTIHELHHGRNVVGAYCLLTNKRQTNSAVLHSIMIKNALNQEYALNDHALSQEYLLLPQKDCLFHLFKSIYGHVQELGLSQRSVNDEQFWTDISMIGVISFIPIEDAIQTFWTLSFHCGDEKQAVFDYFESTYIKEVRQGTRLQPIFPYELWNMNITVQSTTNLKVGIIGLPQVFFIIMPISGKLLRS